MMRAMLHDNEPAGLIEPMAWLLVAASLHPDRIPQGVGSYWADIVKLSKAFAVEDYSVAHIKSLIRQVVELQLRVNEQDSKNCPHCGGHHD